MTMKEIVEVIIAVLFTLAMMGWSGLVIFLNLCCKNEIWDAVYERMGWYETNTERKSY